MLPSRTLRYCWLRWRLSRGLPVKDRSPRIANSQTGFFLNLDAAKAAERSLPGRTNVGLLDAAAGRFGCDRDPSLALGIAEKRPLQTICLSPRVAANLSNFAVLTHSILVVIYEKAFPPLSSRCPDSRLRADVLRRRPTAFAETHALQDEHRLRLRRRSLAGGAGGW